MKFPDNKFINSFVRDSRILNLFMEFEFQKITTQKNSGVPKNKRK